MAAKLRGHINIKNGCYVLSTICNTSVNNITFQARYAYLLTFLLIQCQCQITLGYGRNGRGIVSKTFGNFWLSLKILLKTWSCSHCNLLMLTKIACGITSDNVIFMSHLFVWGFLKITQDGILWVFLSYLQYCFKS